MENKQRDSMIFYRSFFEALRDLDGETKAVLYDAIFEFGLNRAEPVLTGIAKTVFTLIRPQLEANLRKFDNGVKGGRPPLHEPSDNQTETKDEPNGNQTETKGEANVNGNANLNANSNENPKEAKVSPEKADHVRWVVSILNTEAGTSFKADGKATGRLISARIKEGFTGADFKAVIRHKVKQWGGDPEMAEYLRPSTLFGTKFESYLNAAKIAAIDQPRKVSRPADPKF
jgi:uncharacterized phage protein (TIGR02220 family)